MKQLMRANFDFKYWTSPRTEVSVDVDTEITSDQDKRDFLLAVAKILGMEIEVPETYAEKVFNEGNEAHE